MKGPKPKNCAVCGNEFRPYRTTQKVCSPSCAVKYADSKQWKEKKSVWNDQLKTHTNWSQEIDEICQEIARLLDKDCLCISCQKPPSKKNGGHRFSKKAAPQLRHNLLNIWLQCEACNSPKYGNGNPDGYDKGLIEFFGEAAKKEVHDLKLRYPTNKKTIPELIQAKARAKKIVLRLKKENRTYSPQERVELRRLVNTEIGIYC